MTSKTPPLIPNDDLGQFFATKISTHLIIISTYWDELSNDKKTIVKINYEIEKIYTMIKYRLIKYDLKDFIRLYRLKNIKINKLKPITKGYSFNNETGQRIVKQTTGGDYNLYKKLVWEKESVIWSCLDELGLLGKIEIKRRKIR